MALSLATQTSISRQLATTLFGTATAHANASDLLTAVQGVDAAFDLTLNAAVTAVGGTTTVISALALSVTAPSGGSWSAAEKSLIAAYVLEARAGLLT